MIMTKLTTKEIEDLVEETETSEIFESLNKAINTTWDFSKLNSQELEKLIEYLTQLKEVKEYAEKLTKVIFKIRDDLSKI